MNNEETTQPKSTGPDFNQLELDVLTYWKDNDIFKKSLEQTKDGEPFIFYDGPPFATGLPHYGSILPSVIKDAIPRFQTMRGKYVRRRWGWDCHGLPIENIVEQHLKISGKKQIEEVGVDRFNQVCRDNVLTYAKEWGKTIDRIARWVEFDNAYMTMQTSFQESVWWGLKQIWEKDLIYEDRKVLLYCSRCETPVSNFEVAMDNSYRDVTEESVYAKFRLVPRQRIVDFLTDEKTYVLAWTTTPWTLPGNTSLNIGPDITYVLVEQNGERYILAKDRLDVLEGEYEVQSEFAARSLEGLRYEPLYPGVVVDPNDKAHKIYTADFVTIEDGTGMVHNAALYGEEDYQLAKDKDLPRQEMLDHQGRYLDMVPESLRGVFFKDAEKIVLDELTAKNLVYKTKHYTHSYPHCWRCGTPLFYNALPAWFINVQKIKPQLLENNESVNWYPGHLKHGRFAQGIQNAPDWNISRNRYWATALPFWKCENQDCKHVTCIGSIDELKEKSTNFDEVYPDFDRSNLEATDLHRPYIDRVKLSCEKCGSVMSRIPEVIDCWVESGSMPFAELHYPIENEALFKQRYPSDFVVEYIPQTRAWFYVMHVINSILFGKSPLKNVLTTGTILAEDGTKMSKSKKNYPDPNEVIAKYGADSLRFYLLTSPVVNGEDISFSEKGVAEVGRKLHMLLWNMHSFYRMYQKGQGELGAHTNHVLDRWVVAEFNRVHAYVTKQLEAYDTARAGKMITDFINDVSTWYVRRSRDRIKEGGNDSEAALATLGWVLAETAKLIAPFMPFLSEILFRDITGKPSVHLERWTSESSVDETLLKQMHTVRGLVELGLSLRKEHNVKVRQALAEFQFALSDEAGEMDASLNQILADELNVKSVKQVSAVVNRPGWVFKQDGSTNVALNIELTDELRKEGLARELERQIQDLRKKSGLSVGEMVDVLYNTQDEELESALLTLINRKKTFVNQISTNPEVEADFETQAEIEKRPIWLGIVKL
jgi:isoleucyl-tRNA synthetase